MISFTKIVKLFPLQKLFIFLMKIIPSQKLFDIDNLVCLKKYVFREIERFAIYERLTLHLLRPFPRKTY